MISSQLFRPNDVVHFHEDLAPNRTYSMLHKPSYNCTTTPGSGSWCRLNSGGQAVIADHSATGKYIVDGILGLCDEMFQEGNRVMQYLHYTDEPVNELGVGYLNYELLDTLCGEAGAPYDARDWSVATVPHITSLRRWCDTGGLSYSINIDGTEA